VLHALSVHIQLLELPGVLIAQQVNTTQTLVVLSVFLASPVNIQVVVLALVLVVQEEHTVLRVELPPVPAVLLVLIPRQGRLPVLLALRVPIPQQGKVSALLVLRVPIH
jgi:hypothetical protein